MIIDKKNTIGCDKYSDVYSEMFNFLQNFLQDKDRIKEINPLDYSALGLYIGKFVEQEINSSVVQIMRNFCGIEMPEYYCKRDPDFGFDADVKVGKKNIRLNEQVRGGGLTSLKTIPSGDAYYALEELKREDEDGFFSKYPWLYDRIFLEAWRNLFDFRNKTAHIGEIINEEKLKKNFEYFLRFLRYMPDILEAKKELAPEDYIESLPVSKKEEIKRPYIVTQNPTSDKPFAPKEIAQKYCELSDAGEWTEEYYDIAGKYNLDAIIFEGKNGKRGIKDCCEKILVPAKYDGFGFIPKPFIVNRKSINAVRDGKYVLVALDGSGKELTNEYDEIRLATYDHLQSPYVYRKGGMLAWGFMDMSGKEICDNIIDEYMWGLNSLWYTSGEKIGYWQFGFNILPPIYDNIEFPGEPEDPLLFTLNGELGYVRHDGSFLSLTEFNRLEENGEEIIWDFFCEQYDD